MKIVGYGSRLSVGPGDTIEFMVSSSEPTYEAKVVRLIHGDLNPDGPGYSEEPLVSVADGTYRGREQGFVSGSYVLVPSHPVLDLCTGFTLRAWVYPTTPGRGVQGVLTKWSATQHGGYGLFLDKDGALALWLGGRDGEVARVTTAKPLRAFCWYFVEGSFSTETGLLNLCQEPAPLWPLDSSAAEVRTRVDVSPMPTDAPFLMAAYWESGCARGHFNGKIESPRVIASDGSLIADWDLALEISSRTVIDRSANRLHGETVNCPVRAVTGHNWTGREMNWTRAPDEYQAIFFHDDDLEDAAWQVDFEFKVPEGLRSGIYAARIRGDQAEDYIPFFVRPKRGTSTARIALLAPTYSYMAYANEHITSQHPQVSVPLERLQPQDHYAVHHRLLSLYDCHSDGVGCCFSSRLRPIVNMRPKYNLALINAPHQLNADLHLVDWLEAKGHEYDVITDEDLHAEGEALLHPYRVILSGTHPEYWTASMLDGLEAYLQGGGRLMYLGGNGFYWVISVDPTRPHLIELRRGQRGSRPYSSAIGENYHATTGELGGLWRDRGRAPQKLVGVGHAVMGFEPARPFRREAGSFDPRAAFIFDGVAEDEAIGDFGLVMKGAAGHELDRLDHWLGSPPHALVLASATGFSDAYQHAVEEIEVNDGKQGGSANSYVRADMVFFETPNGGAVFSVGSMCWCGSLSHDRYDNNVSRITNNVLSKFASDEPIVPC